MKYLAPVLVLALAASANTQTVQHVIVVVQENRSPDNLFGADSALLAKGGNIWDISQAAPCSWKGKSRPTLLQPLPLDTCFDPIHNHNSWELTYDNGKMDQACAVLPANNTCSKLPYPNYGYVDNSQHILDPYFNVVANYGFANYMFQTNQGASFPAHLFLFSGTSAPVGDDGDPQMFWQWFVADNPTKLNLSGCTASLIQVAVEIDPNGNEGPGYKPPYPPGAGAGFPCYNTKTMADLLDAAGISWKYYTPRYPAGIWTAPAAIAGICSPIVNGQCTGSDWVNHVVTPTETNASPVLTDIQACKLPAVSWVMPDGRWSDHPGTANNEDAGPSWIAALVNAVGGENKYRPQGCDYWSNTVILVLWDDWGGWFDHVSPATSAGGPGIGYPNQTGQQYVYGFRVPLLVVSAYTKPGYVSGPPSTPVCPNYYCHDFGSILGFIEHTFGLGEIYPTYHYADYFAPDGPPSCPTCTYPLADFFGTQFNTFVPINGAKYAPDCFINPKSCYKNFEFSNPDNDGKDDD